MIVTFTLIVFILRPPAYERDVHEGFRTLTECRVAGKKLVQENGGVDKSLFACVEKRHDNKR